VGLLVAKTNDAIIYSKNVWYLLILFMVAISLISPAMAASSTDFSIVQSPTTKTITSVHMLSPTDGWAVGRRGTILKWDGMFWKTVPSPADIDLLDVHGSSPTNIWAVGDDGVTIRWDGASWSVTSSPTMNALLSIHVLSLTEGWAVGAKGTILRWDGSSWKIIPSPTTENLFDIHMLTPNKGRVVGTNGVVLKWDGTSWSLDTILPTHLLTIHILSENDGWAAGDYAIFKWDGRYWSQVYTFGGRIRSIWAVSANEVLAVGAKVMMGREGLLLKWDGRSWQEITLPSSVLLSDIHMLSSGDGWIVGVGGTIIRVTPAGVRGFELFLILSTVILLCAVVSITWYLRKKRKFLSKEWIPPPAPGMAEKDFSQEIHFYMQ